MSNRSGQTSPPTAQRGRKRSFPGEPSRKACQSSAVGLGKNPNHGSSAPSPSVCFAPSLTLGASFVESMSSMRKPYCRAPKRVFEPLVLRLFPIFIHEKSSVFFHFVASLRISIAKPFGVFLLVAALAGCDTSAHPSRKTGEIGPTSTGSNNQTDTPLTVDSPIADTSQSKSNQTNSDEFEIAAQGLELSLIHI